jgi:hypothetical protein
MASELRIGNLIEYLCYDELATPQEEWVENYVDIDDLKWLNELADDENYRPMKLTEDILVRLGFVTGGSMSIFWTLNNVDIWEMHKGKFANVINLPIKSVHHLQNYYYACTGEELTL